MSEYTKGPWHVGGQHKCTVYDKFGQRVADAFEGVMTTQRTDDGCRANARLIAAAPDLLEALEIVLDSLGALTKQHELLDRMDESEANKVWAALYKATGRPMP